MLNVPNIIRKSNSTSVRSVGIGKCSLIQHRNVEIVYLYVQYVWKIKIRLTTNAINTNESEVYTFKDPIFNFSFRDFTAGIEHEAILNMFNVSLLLVC